MFPSFIGPDKRLQLPELGEQFNSSGSWSCTSMLDPDSKSPSLEPSDGVFAVYLANEFICFCLR